jgi:hypothetical protein
MRLHGPKGRSPIQLLHLSLALSGIGAINGPDFTAAGLAKNRGKP